MKGDFSRRTFEAAKHYTAVLQQQGRVQVDADGNESESIHRYLRERTARDVIGATGAPKENAGFGLSVDNGDLVIGAGRFYVDGILCENEEAVSYGAQPYYPVDPGLEDGQYLAVLHVFDRHLTALQDPSIREKALGGPDTCTRVQTAWQVKLLPVLSDEDFSCEGEIASWIAETAEPTGTLAARTSPVPPADNPCLLPPEAGFRGLENQLYRVEVHVGGTRDEARFKWSRDNGSVAVAIEQPIDGTKVVVSSLGRDEKLGLAVGQWVEILDDRMELLDGHGALARITDIQAETRELTLDAAVLPQVDMEAHPILRRWDQDTADSVVAATSEWLALEDGIEVLLSDGTYRVGDYWLIPARTAVSAETGGIEWPVDGSGDPLAEAPFGVRHRYARLALVTFDGETFQVGADCRPIFPPLTDLPEGGGETKVCVCRLVAVPGDGWEKIFQEIPEGADARICFQTGEYPLRKLVKVRGRGRITLHGAGAGTRVISRTQSTLIFEQCAGVSIREMHFEVKKAQDRAAGVLELIDCEDVGLEDVDIVSPRGEEGESIGLVVTQRKVAGSLRVVHCDFQAGKGHTAVHLTQVAQTHFEGNTIRANAGPGIVATGTALGELHAVHNSMRNVTVGIVLALASEESRRPLAERVVVTDNTVSCVPGLDAAAGAEKLSYALRFAHCDSLSVETNRLSVSSRTEEPGTVRGAGVETSGVHGRFMMVRANHISGYFAGVEMRPAAGSLPKPLWLVADNLIERAEVAVDAPQGTPVKVKGNVNP